MLLGMNTPLVRSIKSGIYVNVIKDWLKIFPRDQVMFIKSEDMFKDPEQEYLKVLDFLGLERITFKKYGRHNVARCKPDMYPTRRRIKWNGIT